MGFSYLGIHQIQEIIKLIPMEELPQKKLTEDSCKEFLSQDERLKMKYPKDWEETENIDMTKIIPQEYIKQYNIQLPLFALKVKGYGYFSQLTVLEMEINIQEDFKEVEKVLKKINQENGWSMTIINKTTEENIVIFETKYQKPGQTNMYAKEKIVFLEPKENKKKVYIVTISGPEESWQEISEEANFVINSVSLF